MGVFYYAMLPPINVHSSLFWTFVVMAIVVYFVINSLLSASVTITRLVKGKNTNLNYKSYKLLMVIPIIIVLTLIVNFVCSPLFNSKSYYSRIKVNENPENFDGMIYVCDPEATEINDFSKKATYKGSWLYYYGDGKYGVQKTLAEAEAANAVYSNGEFPPYGLQIDAKELTVYTNATGTITPNKSNCTATIADESIATITQDEVTGVVTVTPVKVGTTTVTFSYTDGTDVTTKECVITVSEPPTTIDVAAAKSVYVKKSVKLGAKVANGKGTTTYKSSNTKIAKVDSKGNVTGVKAGKATITVSNNGASEKVTVTVKNPVVKIGGKTVTAGKTLNTSVKAKKTLKVAVSNAVGKTTYKTSNKKVATVTSKAVKGVKKGTATITIKASGVSFKAKVKVTK